MVLVCDVYFVSGSTLSDQWQVSELHKVGGCPRVPGCCQNN